MCTERANIRHSPQVQLNNQFSSFTGAVLELNSNQTASGVAGTAQKEKSAAKHEPSYTVCILKMTLQLNLNGVHIRVHAHALSRRCQRSIAFTRGWGGQRSMATFLSLAPFLTALQQPMSLCRSRSWIARAWPLVSCLHFMYNPEMEVPVPTQRWVINYK